MAKISVAPSIMFEDEPEQESKEKGTTLIIHLPIEQLRRIAKTEGITSLARETEHFTETTSFHGALRVHQGKSYVKVFWLTVIIAAVIMFLVQFVQLINTFNSKPTVSKVSFILPTSGMEFPGVTICNYNSIRKSYVEELNSTGLFSELLLDYVAQSYVQVEALYENADPDFLLNGHLAYLNYTNNVDRNFTINEFFKAAGFTCKGILKMCSFGGRYFDCCEHAVPVLTDLGLCYQFRMMHASDTWMRYQKQAGNFYGLQIVADFHSEQQISTHSATDGQDSPLFTDNFENGFRFYVHPLKAIAYLSNEGISVSPSSRVYAAVNPSRFLLLSKDEWGNCTDRWMSDYVTELPYSAINCRALCRARYFAEKCGCSPFRFNIDNKYKVCSPYEIYQCTKRNDFQRDDENKLGLQLPECTECSVECDSWVYHSYNSYGSGFSEDAIRWFAKQDGNWTSKYVRDNFVVINIFFPDMAYTEYSQVQATGLTETLSDIGGNMGLFLGASVVTVCEIVIYLAKISWIGISKRRREYLALKKRKEVEKEKQLAEAIESGSFAPRHKLSTAQRMKEIGSTFIESFNRKESHSDVKRKVALNEKVPSKKKSQIEENYGVEPTSSSEHHVSVIKVQPDYSTNHARNRRRSEMPFGSDLIQLRIDLEALQRPRSRTNPECEPDSPHDRQQAREQPSPDRPPLILGHFLTVPEETHDEVLDDDH